MVPIESQPPPPIVAPVPDGAGNLFDWSRVDNVSRRESVRHSRRGTPRGAPQNHGVSPLPERSKGRPRARSTIQGEFFRHEAVALGVDGSETLGVDEGFFARDGDGREAATSLETTLDTALSPKERGRAIRMLGLDGNNPEATIKDWKALARLKQDTLGDFGFEDLGRKLRNLGLLGAARKEGRALVESIAGADGDEKRLNASVQTLLERIKVAFPDSWQWVGAGAALAGAAMLTKRGRQGAALLLLAGGFASCVGGSAVDGQEGGSNVPDLFIQINQAGIRQTYVDNALPSSPDFGQTYGVSSEIAPNYATLTTTLLGKMKNDYPHITPKSISYVYLKEERGSRSLEFSIISTNQTAETGEPLFVAAYLDKGNVRITTVVQRREKRFPVSYGDGTSGEEDAIVYWLVERINDQGELVLGTPLEVIVERDDDRYVIVLDPTGDGDAFIFVPRADIGDKTVFVGAGGRFGPDFAALSPVSGIPPMEAAPAEELPATATLEPSPTSLPTEVPTAIVLEPLSSMDIAPDTIEKHGSICGSPDVLARADEVAAQFWATHDREEMMGGMDKDFHRYVVVGDPGTRGAVIETDAIAIGMVEIQLPEGMYLADGVTQADRDTGVVCMFFQIPQTEKPIAALARIWTETTGTVVRVINANGEYLDRLESNEGDTMRKTIGKPVKLALLVKPATTAEPDYRLQVRRSALLGLVSRLFGANAELSNQGVIQKLLDAASDKDGHINLSHYMVTFLTIDPNFLK